MSDQHNDPAPWHSIRPWTPHLILSVREITSVSATFILSSSLSTPTVIPECNDSSECEHNDINHADADATTRGIIADALSMGLSVSINGSPWQRVLIRLHDPVDEAVIIIYGLMPGRQYDIDLGLVQGGQASCIRRQVVTEEAEASVENVRMDEGSSTSFLLPSSSSSSSSSLSSSLSSSSSSSDPTPILPSPSGTSQIPRSTTPPQEDRLPALQSKLSAIQTQITNLSATLKSMRRDSHKSDATLKSEIEVLNRASEKASAAEAKARQRIRTLEDAVRKANEGKEEIDRVINELEGEVPGLRKQVRGREEECEALRKDAVKARRERETKEEERRRRVEGVKTDIGSVEHRLERLGGRQEKLEGTVLPDLEKTLRELEKEIQEVEGGDGAGGQYRVPIGRLMTIPPVSPPQYRRHQPRTLSGYRIGQDVAPHGMGLSNCTGGALAHASSSAFSHSSGSSQSKIACQSHSTSSVPISHTPGSVLPNSTTATATTSMLSSKAPPFEPAHGFRSAFPPLNPPACISPIQRPIGTFQRTGRGTLSNGVTDPDGTRAARYDMI